MAILSKDGAIEELKRGSPIIFQTDTLPAIGCLPMFSEIIYKVKRRDKNKALILMASELSQIIRFVSDEAIKDVEEIGTKYWPGSLTLVVPRNGDKELNFLSRDQTLGIRIPDCLSVQSLIKEIGPLATSSANISGLSPSFNAKSVAEDLPNIDILGPVPWGSCSGQASTIISWVDKGRWKLLRKGELEIRTID